MELIIVGGVLLAIVLMKLIWNVVSGAVDNGLEWLIHTFGKERAVKELEERKRWTSRTRCDG